MASLTLRNLSDDVHRALRERAAQHGRSTEAEVTAILEDAVKPASALKLGSLLADIGREVNFPDAVIDLINERDRAQPREVSFQKGCGAKVINPWSP